MAIPAEGSRIARRVRGMSYLPQSRGPPPFGNGRVSFVPGPRLATLLCGPPRRQCDRHRPGGRGSPISMDREQASHDTETPPATAAGSAALGELAWLFLRLGATSFGGPAAHIALMEHEVVRRRGWLLAGPVPRPARGDQPDPRPQLDRDGHPRRLAPCPLGGAARRRRLLHRPGGADRPGLRLGLRAVRPPARGRRAALRRQAGDHRRGRAGALAARAARPEVEDAGRRRRPVRGRSTPWASTSWSSSSGPVSSSPASGGPPPLGRRQ